MHQQTVDRRPPTGEEVLREITGMLAAVLDEYGLADVEVTMATRFTEDLELESIDLVTLSSRLQERWGDHVNFAEFIAGMELDEIIGLTVGRLVEYVLDRLHGAAPEQSAARS
ncbi:acyl carrier protein [Kitasatospora sp. HPMI-4]|uniref:acyl carrier protein n=1 Tax=Kitasatospora sp. HPMI-4 TaxID=3448443 RepID=UPI003F1A0495